MAWSSSYLEQAGLSMEREREEEARERSSRTIMVRRNSEHDNTEHRTRGH